jgi:MipA family protein
MAASLNWLSHKVLGSSVDVLYGGLVLEACSKSKRALRCSIAVTLGVCFAQTASAAEMSNRQPVPTDAAPARVHDLVIEIGAGGAMRPAYEGARGYEFDPTGFFSLHYLWVPGFGIVKNEQRAEGFSVGPSFRYVRKRDSGDHPELRGLDSVDAAFELGGRFAYQWSMFRPWLAVRHGLGGHDGIVAETGLELRFRPSAVTEFAVGPRASFATGEYMKTYFGVTNAESVRSGLGVYNPGSGIKGAGVEVSGRYEFTPQWALVGMANYERLIGDVAASPLVKLGDENQITARLGLSYKLGSKLFND